MKSDILPVKIKSTSAVAPEHQLVYEDDPDSEGYVLTAGGRALQRVQQDLKTSSNPLFPAVTLTVERVDWQRTLAVATAAERKQLLRRVGAGVIKVKAATNKDRRDGR
jgi:hypothetical protein